MNNIMDEKWCHQLIKAWNSKICTTTELAGAGSVLLQITSSGIEFRLVFNWADDGILSTRRLNEDDKKNLPMFSASALYWDKFFLGEFSAVEGVREGYIKYSGPTRFALDYGNAFDEIVAIARTIGM